LLEHELGFLFELKGESTGVAQGLSKDLFRIGSDAENDMVLPDAGVALYQAEIRYDDPRFVIKNYSLEGAAFLNGEAFEEATLRKGDILTLGDATFRFVPRGEALTQEELWRSVGGRMTTTKAGPGVLKRMTFLIALSVIAIAAVVWILVSQTKKKDLPFLLETDAPIGTAVSGVDPRVLMELYTHGIDLLSARHWDRAVVSLGKVREESPNYKEVDRLYQQALTESSHLERLEQGKGLFLEGDLGPSRAVLQEIPESSVYYREAEKLTREVEDRLVAERVELARAAMEKQDWASARTRIQEILAQVPNHEEASRMLQEIQIHQGAPQQGWYYSRREPQAEPEEAAKPAAPVAAAPEPAAASKPARGVAASKPSRSAAPAATEAPSLRRARSSYLQGNTEASLDIRDRLLKRGVAGETARKAIEMRSRLLAAKSYFQQARTLQEEGRILEAVDMWESFLEADRELSGDGTSAPFRKASSALSQICCGRGRAAFEAGDVVSAARLWNMASRMDPGCKEVKAGLNQPADSAQKFYREGYSLQTFNPSGALEKWKMVLKIVPPGDPYYQKARSQIERYSVVP